MKDKIYEILTGIRPECDFRASEDFFEDGFRDSMDFTAFINALNAEFDIELDGMDILPDNFYNIDAIVELLGRYGKQ